jgi:transposase
VSGPKPLYKPQFSRSNVHRVEKVLRSSKAPYGQARRAKLASLLHSQPEIGNTEAARLVDMHDQTVRRWRRRWATEGFSLEDKPRSGRPRFFRAEDPRAG